MQLRRYRFNTDADRISYNFLSMVAENFRHHGTIREKYDAVTRSSETAVKSGYNITKGMAERVGMSLS
jgi:neutral trehalase